MPAAQIPNQIHIQNEHCYAELNFCSFHEGKVHAGGRKSTLRKLEWLLDYIPKCFYMCTCHGIDISDKKTVCLYMFYYVAVPLADDVLEENPNNYRGLILKSFSSGFKFVDLGIFKPAAWLPMQKLAM